MLPSRLSPGLSQPAGASSEPVAGVGEVVVVGLGPAGREWQTPEAVEALEQALFAKLGVEASMEA